MWLRPVAILVLCYALLKVTKEDVLRYRFLVAMLGASTLLVVFHLVPMPPAFWQGLAGRQILVDLGAVLGAGDIWRPISMATGPTWNALYSLSVPWAFLLLILPLRRDDLMKVVGAATAVLLLSALIAFAQAAGMGLDFYRISNPNAGLFANRNHQAVALSCLFPMMAAMAVLADSNRVSMAVRWSLVAIAFLALILLLLIIGSRAGIVTALVGLASIPFVVGRSNAPVKSLTRKLIGAGAVFTLLAAAFVVWSVTASNRNLLFLRFTQLDAADDARFPLWAASADLVAKYFPFGSGAGTFVEVFQIDEPDSLLGPQYWNHAHNDWLEVVMTTGVPGLVLLMIAVVGFAVAAGRAARAWRSRRRVHVLAKLGCVIVAIMGVASVVDYPLRTPAAMCVFALAAVLAAQREAGRAVNRDLTGSSREL